MLAALLDNPTGISLSLDALPGFLALPVVDEAEATEFLAFSTDMILSDDIDGHAIGILVPRSLGLEPAADNYPPWRPRRWSATPAARLLDSLLFLADEHSALVDTVFGGLGMIGTRALLGMRSAAGFAAADYANPLATAARATFLANSTASLAALRETFVLFGQAVPQPAPEGAAAAPPPAGAAAAPPHAADVPPNAALAANLEQLRQAAVFLIGHAASPNAHRFALSQCATALVSCVNLHATQLQLQGSFAAVPARTVAEIYVRAGQPAPELGAAAQANNDALPLGHPQPGGLPLGGAINVGAMHQHQLPAAVPAAALGGQGAYGNALPPPGAFLALAPRAPTLNPPPGTPLPSRYIPLGAWACPADFLTDPTDPEEIMLAKSQEMVLTQSGGYVPKVKVSTPKPLQNSIDLLFGGARLGAWKAACNIWVMQEATEHMHFVHACVQLERNGRTWAVVRDIEMQYRRGMFTGKYTSWRDDNALAALVVLSSTQMPSRATGATKSADGGGEAKGRKRPKDESKPVFKHEQDSKGIDICRNWNNGHPCFGKGKGKGKTCSMSHTCAVCLGNHKACDHH